MSLSSQPMRYSLFRKPVREEDVLRLRNVQIGALLPLLVCFVFLQMTANIYRRAPPVDPERDHELAPCSPTADRSPGETTHFPLTSLQSAEEDP